MLLELQPAIRLPRRVPPDLRHGVRDEDLVVGTPLPSNTVDDLRVLLVSKVCAGGEPAAHVLTLRFNFAGMPATERELVDRMIAAELALAKDHIIDQLVSRTPHAPGLLDRIYMEKSR